MEDGIWPLDSSGPSTGWTGKWSLDGATPTVEELEVDEEPIDGTGDNSSSSSTSSSAPF